MDTALPSRQPLPCPFQHVPRPPWPGGKIGSRLREVPHLPGSPAGPASLPTLPCHGVPSSPESSHGSVRAGHTWAWGPGVGPGPRPWQAGPLAWPSLQRTSGARKQRNRFQGNFLSSVSSRFPPLPVLGRTGRAWAGPMIPGKSRTLRLSQGSESREAVLGTGRKPREGFRVEQRGGAWTPRRDLLQRGLEVRKEGRKECGAQLVRGCNEGVHNGNITRRPEMPVRLTGP